MFSRIFFLILVKDFNKKVFVKRYPIKKFSLQLLTSKRFLSQVLVENIAMKKLWSKKGLAKTISPTVSMPIIFFQWLLMLILLETLVIRHFLTLAAQLQQAGVGMSGLLSMLVETLILVGMILYLLYSKPNNIFCMIEYYYLNRIFFLGGQGVCNITQHQPAPFKTLAFLLQSQK